MLALAPTRPALTVRTVARKAQRSSFVIKASGDKVSSARLGLPSLC